MENASRALLIAGSILVALITISIFIYAFSHMGELVGASDENSKNAELIQFNTRI